MKQKTGRKLLSVLLALVLAVGLLLPGSMSVSAAEYKSGTVYFQNLRAGDIVRSGVIIKTNNSNENCKMTGADYDSEIGNSGFGMFEDLVVRSLTKGTTPGYT